MRNDSIQHIWARMASTNRLDEILRVQALEAVRNVANWLEKSERFKLLRFIPSVSNYVFEVDIGDVRYFAKYNYLGLSRASLLANMDQLPSDLLLARQHEHLQAQPTLKRQYEQLQYLQELVPTHIAPSLIYADGVLLVECVPHVRTLQEIGLDGDPRASAAYQAAFEVLQKIHAVDTYQALAAGKATVPAGRSADIVETFIKKFVSERIGEQFQDLYAATELDRWRQHAPLFRELPEHILEYLRPSASRPAVLCFGDFKPENILVRAEGSIVLVDPELRVGEGLQDVAKMISRSLLAIGTSQIPLSHKQQLLQNLQEFTVQSRAVNYSRANFWDEEYCVSLVLADMLNILSTYLKLGAHALSVYPEYVQNVYARRHVLAKTICDVTRRRNGITSTTIETLAQHFLKAM